nr:hypothetical protein [Tanacetum cinerariifolium]
MFVTHLDIKKEEVDSPVRVVSPSSEDPQNDSPDTSADQQLQDRAENIPLEHEADNLEGSLQVPIELSTHGNNDLASSLTGSTSYEDFLDHVDKKLNEIEDEVSTAVKFSALILERDESPKNMKVQQLMEILGAVQHVRQRIAVMMPTKADIQINGCKRNESVFGTAAGEKFKEDLFAYCIENGILQDSSELSHDNTNVVNALREPFVVNQDPGNNSSQSPPQINHHCCYECGDPLEDIFCHQCTCELCGRGAHYGYNFPLKVPVVPNSEPFNDQTVNELLQTLPSFDTTCYSEDRNSFTYDSTSNLVHDSPNVFSPPLQPLIDSYEFYGNDAYYGQDCSIQFPVIHQPIREKTCAELLAEEQEANIDTQPFMYSVIPQPPQEEMSVEFLQERRNQMDYVKTFLRKFNRISFYELPKVLSLAWETILEIELAFDNKHCQPEDILELFQRLQTDVQNIHEELGMYINTPNWDRPTVCYYDDDDEDYAIALTPSLSTEDPDHSLSMGDEHLDTIPATKSDEFIKSSVENLIPIPSEFEGVPDNMCDVPFHVNFPPLDVSKDQFEDFSNSNDEFTSTDDDSFSIDNIEYVEASPPDSEPVSSEVMEIVIPKVGGIDDDILLTIKDDTLCEKLLNINLLIANIKSLNNPTSSFDFMIKFSSSSLNSLLEETSTFDNSLPELETFCFDLEEISSGSTTTRSDISLPEYEVFCDDHIKEISSGSTTTHSDYSLYGSFIFDLSINLFPPTDRSDFYEFIDEPTYIISPLDESLFAYVVWIFLPFLSYSVAPKFLLSFGNEDTIFDPGIFSYHISSFVPDVSHRSETFIKFNVLNESPMEISFSTCSPIDQ